MIESIGFGTVPTQLEPTLLEMQAKPSQAMSCFILTFTNLNCNKIVYQRKYSKSKPSRIAISIISATCKKSWTHFKHVYRMEHIQRYTVFHLPFFCICNMLNKSIRKIEM